jgi:hypothetical protein
MSSCLCRRAFVGLLIGGLSVVLPACTPPVRGTYHMETGGFTLDFKGNGTVTVSGLGESGTYDFTVDGDRITVLNFEGGQNLELTRNSDGSLNSPIGTFRQRT